MQFTDSIAICNPQIKCTLLKFIRFCVPHRLCLSTLAISAAVNRIYLIKIRNSLSIQSNAFTVLLYHEELFLQVNIVELHLHLSLNLNKFNGQVI